MLPRVLAPLLMLSLAVLLAVAPATAARRRSVSGLPPPPPVDEEDVTGGGGGGSIAGLLGAVEVLSASNPRAVLIKVSNWRRNSGEWGIGVGLATGGFVRLQLRLRCVRL